VCFVSLIYLNVFRSAAGKVTAGLAESNDSIPLGLQLIFGIRHSENITDALASIHWLRVPERILFKVAVLSYRAVNGNAPAYLLLHQRH